MFECKVCSEKDKRIQDLKDEIANLRALVYPPKDAKIPLIQLEADKVLSADDEVMDLTEEELAEQARIISQRDQLLSGNY